MARRRSWAPLLGAAFTLAVLLVTLTAPVPEGSQRWLRAGERSDPVEYQADAAATGAELARMTAQLTRFEEDQDRRATFLRMYSQMTAGTIDALGDPDRFEDPAWVRALLLRFASYYFTALDATDTGDEDRVPPAWAVAHLEASNGAPHVLADALLGMNAHINYDLALVTRDLLVAEAHDKALPVRAVAERRQGDYRRVDDVIAEVITAALATMGDDPAAVRAFDQAALSRPDLAAQWAEGVAGWRADAWDSAVALAEDPAGAPRRIRALARWSRNWASVIVGVDQYLDGAPEGEVRRVETLLEDTAQVARIVRAANQAGVVLPNPQVARRLVLPDRR